MVINNTPNNIIKYNCMLDGSSYSLRVNYNRNMKREPKISSLIDKACFDYNLIEEGDKILIGVSGGKDSTVLAEYFSNRAKRPFCGFTYKALNIQSDFAPPFPAEIKMCTNKYEI